VVSLSNHERRAAPPFNKLSATDLYRVFTTFANAYSAKPLRSLAQLKGDEFHSMASI
jgi:hypothetical protein